VFNKDLFCRGVQVAAKRGYKVIAIDSGESKRELCLKLGATAFLDFKKDKVSEGAHRVCGPEVCN
jgi:propanol-preferring alcohol dehydrogenase